MALHPNTPKPSGPEIKKMLAPYPSKNGRKLPPPKTPKPGGK